MLLVYILYQFIDGHPLDAHPVAQCNVQVCVLLTDPNDNGMTMWLMLLVRLYRVPVSESSQGHKEPGSELPEAKTRQSLQDCVICGGL